MIGRGRVLDSLLSTLEFCHTHLCHLLRISKNRTEVQLLDTLLLACYCKLLVVHSCWTVGYKQLEFWLENTGT